MKTILIVEDDAEIRKLVTRYLEENEMRVLQASNGHDMDHRLAEANVHLILLDLMLPGEDGLSICRRLRATSQIPIIMVTAQKDDIERVVGLEMGADDYVTKPFNPRELLARIRAVLRRHSLSTPHVSTNVSRFEFAGWQLDIGLRRLHNPQGARVSLTGAELELLLVFCERPGRVLSRDALIELTRGRQANPEERSVDILVSRLRQKMEKNPRDPELLQTLRSSGYIFTPDVTAQ